MEKIYQSKNLEETQKIAELIGKQLKGGEIIELIGDLGSGKTTLVKSLVKAAGSKDHVSSPSFTINKLYKTDRLNIHHFDFYRLNEPALMANELEEVIHDQNNVTLIEWPGIVSNVLPVTRLQIKLKAKGDTEREILISGPEELIYLIQGSK
jgi:tRNA threonylcarbamoyladenosine biosynthesis protein TsaE